MDNYDMITSAHNNLLVTQYDIMYSHMNDLEYLKDADDTTLKFIEFRKSCTIPINTFDEKVAFMRQFYDKNEQEKKKEEIERLKKEKAKLIELAKERYASKSFFWKLSHKGESPKKLDFDSMSDYEINDLYADEGERRIR